MPCCLCACQISDVVVNQEMPFIRATPKGPWVIEITVTVYRVVIPSSAWLLHDVTPLWRGVQCVLDKDAIVCASPVVVEML